jgi:hypothetical protein
MRQYVKSATMPEAEAAGQQSQVDSDMILSMLSKMTFYFNSMVDPFTNRFYYRCLPKRPNIPESRRRLHGHSPIRDLGAAWDTANLLTFWDQTSTDRAPCKAMKARLSASVIATINAYIGPTWLTFDDSPWCVALPSRFLKEPSTIAHSAFMILSSLGARQLSILDPPVVPIDSLVRGILHMQKDNGAFAIHFGNDDILQGIEFYPGEAMLALLASYEASADSPDLLSPSARMKVVPALQRAFIFYSAYYRHDNVDERYTSFFGNWQVQCFARLFDALHHEEQKQESAIANANTNLDATSSVTATAVADYVLELCDSIVASGPWQLLRKGNYTNLSTVEIACGLEALAEGCRLAVELHSASSSLSASGKLSGYWPYVESAIQFVANVQNEVPDGVIGSGGLGYGMLVPEQRLDVTGHAVNALIKVYEVQNTLLRSRPVVLP